MIKISGNNATTKSEGIQSIGLKLEEEGGYQCVLYEPVG